MKKLILFIVAFLSFSFVAEAQLYHAAQKLRLLKQIGDANKQTVRDSLIVLSPGVRIVNGLVLQSTFSVSGAVTGDLDVTGAITALKTTEQFRLSYDAANYMTFTLAADGHTTIATVDEGAGVEADINFNPDGNVGIKTAAPSVALDVTGAIKASTDITATNDVIADSVRGTTGMRTGGLTADNIGIGGTAGTLLQLLGADAYITLQNTTAENGEGGAETKIIFEDHANAALAQIEGSHSGTSDDTKGKFIVSTHDGSALNANFKIDETGNVAIGRSAVADELRPSFSILGDADSDGTTTSETLTFDLTGASTPTQAFWTVNSTQAGGVVFNTAIGIGTPGLPASKLYVQGGWITHNGGVGVDGRVDAIGGTGKDAFIQLKADVFEDNADLWQLKARDGDDFAIISYATGSLIDIISLTSTSATINKDFETVLYNRSATILTQDCFDSYVQAQDYADHWDVATLNVAGAGTNELSTEASHITLTTDGNGANETEGTKSIQAHIIRADKPRSTFHVELGQTATTNYYCGWNTQATNTVAADDKFVMIVYEVGTATWQLWIDNGAGASIDKYVSDVTVTTSDFIFDLWSDASGNIGFSINGVEKTHSLTEVMQADGHYVIVGQLQTTDNPARVASIDWIEWEKDK